MARSFHQKKSSSISLISGYLQCYHKLDHFFGILVTQMSQFADKSYRVAGYWGQKLV
jgi:hypothetical protein